MVNIILLAVCCFHLWRLALIEVFVWCALPFLSFFRSFIHSIVHSFAFFLLNPFIFCCWTLLLLLHSQSQTASAHVCVMCKPFFYSLFLTVAAFHFISSFRCLVNQNHWPQPRNAYATVKNSESRRTHKHTQTEAEREPTTTTEWILLYQLCDLVYLVSNSSEHKHTKRAHLNLTFTAPTNSKKHQFFFVCLVRSCFYLVNKPNAVYLFREIEHLWTEWRGKNGIICSRNDSFELSRCQKKWNWRWFLLRLVHCLSLLVGYFSFFGSIVLPLISLFKVWRFRCEFSKCFPSCGCARLHSEHPKKATKSVMNSRRCGEWFKTPAKVLIVISVIRKP